MLAYHKFNMKLYLFVLKFEISDSGAAMENIWKKYFTQTHEQSVTEFRTVS